MDVSVGLLQLLRDVRKKRDKKGLFSDTSFLKKKGYSSPQGHANECEGLPEQRDSCSQL